MCCYKTLHKNEHGYVIRCDGCHRLQLGYGTVILSFTDEEYYDFLTLVGAQYENNKDAMFRDQKAIQIPTAARSVTLIFTVNELSRLFHLLIQGRNSTEHEKLFAYNEN